MFARQTIPTEGRALEQTLETLGPQGRLNYESLLLLRQDLDYIKWSDTLSKNQEMKHFWIDCHEDWGLAAARFREDLQYVPALSVATYGKPHLTHVSLATYSGNVAVLGLYRLEQKHCAFETYEKAIPLEARNWLESPSIIKISADSVAGIEPLQQDPYKFKIKTAFETKKLYNIFKESGLIRTVLPKTGTGTLEWQAAWVHRYHSRQCSQGAWEVLLGPSEYRNWPRYREPTWRPASRGPRSDHEAAFFYHEATAPHAFVQGLMMHGLAYGSVPNLNGEKPFSQLYVDFLVEHGGVTLPEDGKGPPHTNLLKMAQELVLESIVPAPKKKARDANGVPRPIVPEKDADAAVPPEKLVLLSPAPALSLRGSPARVSPPQVSLPQVSPPQVSPTCTTSSSTVGMLPGTKAPPAAVDGAGGEDLELMLHDNDRFEDEEGEGGEHAAAENAGRRQVTVGDLRNALRALSSPPPPERLRHSIEERRHRPGPPPPPDRPPFQVEERRQRPGPPPPPNRPPFRVGERTQRPGPPPPPNRSPFEVEDRRSVLYRSQPQPPGRPSWQLETSNATSGASRLGRHSHLVDPGFNHSHEDVRSRLTLLQAAQAFSRRTADSVAVPLRPDLNQRLALRNRPTGEAAEREEEIQAHMEAEEQRREHGDPAIQSNPAMLGNAVLTAEERAKNPFVPQPKFHRKCDYCSAGHCSRFVRGTTTPNCRKFIEQMRNTPTRRQCKYVRCREGEQHHTSVCPQLHARCERCGCRGHGPQDRCDLSNADIMQGLRYDFEKFAGFGLYTKRRFEDNPWGWYPAPPNARRSPPYMDYMTISHMHVLDALDSVRSIFHSGAGFAEPPSRRYPLERTVADSVASGIDNEDILDETGPTELEENILPQSGQQVEQPRSQERMQEERAGWRTRYQSGEEREETVSLRSGEQDDQQRGRGGVQRERAGRNVRADYRGRRDSRARERRLSDYRRHSDRRTRSLTVPSGSRNRGSAVNRTPRRTESLGRRGPARETANQTRDVQMQPSRPASQENSRREMSTNAERVQSDTPRSYNQGAAQGDFDYDRDCRQQ